MSLTKFHTLSRFLILFWCFHCYFEQVNTSRETCLQYISTETVLAQSHAHALHNSAKLQNKKRIIRQPVPHPDVFWRYRFLEVKDWIVQRYPNPPPPPAPPIIVPECPKYLIFNVFKEGYLCLLKIFLFSSIHRLYFIQLVKYIWKKCYKNFLSAFFGRRYCSNGTKYTWMRDTDNITIHKKIERKIF